MPEAGRDLEGMEDMDAIISYLDEENKYSSSSDSYRP